MTVAQKCSHVRTDIVYPKIGGVITTMTAMMALMSEAAVGLDQLLSSGFCSLK